MTKFDSNPFAVLDLDHGDSDDSGYIEDEPESPSSDPPPHEIQTCASFEQELLQRIDPEVWELVRRKDRPNIRAGDLPAAVRAINYERSRYDTFIPPGDWRKHAQEMIVQHRRETGILPANAKPGNDESVLSHGAPQDLFDHGLERKISLRIHQTQGIIVKHVDLHHFSRGNAPEGQGNIIPMFSGGEILEKCRLFLIVGRIGDQILECPIYTFGGLGLRYRNKATWPEYCSLKPLHVCADDFVNQSPGNAVLDIVSMEQDYQLKDTMVVRLSDVRSRSFCTGVKIIASIAPKGREYAAQLLMELMSKAVAPARNG